MAQFRSVAVTVTVTPNHPQQPILTYIYIYTHMYITTDYIVPLVPEQQEREVSAPILCTHFVWPGISPASARIYLAGRALPYYVYHAVL